MRGVGVDAFESGRVLVQMILDGDRRDDCDGPTRDFVTRRERNRVVSVGSAAVCAHRRCLTHECFINTYTHTTAVTNPCASVVSASVRRCFSASVLQS